MSQFDSGWGSAPSTNYEQLAERFRPLFARIRQGAIERELQRQLPFEQIEWLKQSGFTALRVPPEYGGSGVTLPELFNLLTELAEADSNLVQSIRGHLGFVENVLNGENGQRREKWLPLLGRGDIVGPAWSEAGDVKQQEFSTQVRRSGKQWRLDGTKFYTTGSLYSDWIDVGITDEKGETAAVTVSRTADGVSVIDDWNGFGQTLTASGTAVFDNVLLTEDEIYSESKFRYAPGFYQLIHLATLAGIGRAQSNELAGQVAARKRTYSIGNGPRVAQDPQILQVVGRVRGAAYASGAIVLKSAEALQRAFDARFAGDEQQEVQVNAIAELEVSQSLNVVSDLILNATTIIFDALGASATLKPLALDRFWRNARTLSSHNPRIYKDRIVGDFAVNGTLPPAQWRIGVVDKG
ncbi:monooxygenase [Erwinia typographi]|uniref:Monooxygenase n=1 Tax=Erwinia typographi TaxID=371042 RepID=A0A0A3Z6H7_9GAMM|nr:acyl-CoA dehydrogenase family protein [Erwinia typographi]KGT93364.1 monooxygenase [Erwinia typographi]